MSTIKRQTTIGGYDQTKASSSSQLSTIKRHRTTLSILNKPCSSSPSQLPLIKRGKMMAEYVETTKKKDKCHIDQQLARAFYANDIAFRVIEDPEFVKALSAINSSYQPPNRRAVSCIAFNSIIDRLSL
jgi:hypothetical protein